MARRTRWSYSEGDYRDVRVLVWEARNGMLYGMAREGSRIVEARHSLGHRDRERAIAWAKTHHDQLRQRLSSPNVPTAGRVFDLYLERQREVYPDPHSRARKAQERGATFWRAVLGACHLEEDLDHDTLDRLGRKRQRGEIDAQGQPVAGKDRIPVGPRTYAADLEWLRACLLWAVAKIVRGAPLLKRNAMAGYALPTVANPRRPVAMRDRYLALQRVTPQITMEIRTEGKRIAVPSYLPELLALAHHTGRRIGAIVQLRYRDLRLGEGPHGAIEWPGDTDKMGKAWLAPLNADVRSVLDRLLAARPGLGGAYLFPSPRNPRRAVSVDLVSDWLERAERLANLPTHDGSLWHAFRRGWATSRKHFPAQDVAQAGGWSDLTSLQTAYQQPDTQTMQRVVEA
jgi:integrase